MAKFQCKKCDRSFKMAAHLARHATATHGTAPKTKRRRVDRKRDTAVLNSMVKEVRRLWAFEEQASVQLKEGYAALAALQRANDKLEQQNADLRGKLLDARRDAKAASSYVPLAERLAEKDREVLDRLMRARP